MTSLTQWTFTQRAETFIILLELGTLPISKRNQIKLYMCCQLHMSKSHGKQTEILQFDGNIDKIKNGKLFWHLIYFSVRPCGGDCGYHWNVICLIYAGWNTSTASGSVVHKRRLLFYFSFGRITLLCLPTEGDFPSFSDIVFPFGGQRVYFLLS